MSASYYLSGKYTNIYWLTGAGSCLFPATPNFLDPDLGSEYDVLKTAALTVFKEKSAVQFKSAQLAAALNGDRTGDDAPWEYVTGAAYPTFKWNYDPTQDNADIMTAKTAVEEASYAATQAEAADAAGAKAKAGEIIAALSLNGVTPAVNDGQFSAATAGTADDPDGTDGSYMFTVELSKGGGTPQTTEELTLTITATPYDPTQDNADIAAAKTAVEGASYAATQAEAADAAGAKAKAEGIVAALSLNGVTPAVNDGQFSAATAGTADDTDGTDGSYMFTVELSKGGGTPQTTEELTLTITATPYEAAQGSGGGGSSGGSSSNTDASGGSSSDNSTGGGGASVPTVTVPEGSVAVPSDTVIDESTGVATLPSGGEITLAGGATALIVPPDTTIDLDTGIITVTQSGGLTLADGTTELTVPPDTTIDPSTGIITVTQGGAVTVPASDVSDGPGIEFIVPPGTAIDPATGTVSVAADAGALTLPGATGAGQAIEILVPEGTTIDPATGTVTAVKGGWVVLPGSNHVLETPMDMRRGASVGDDLEFNVTPGTTVDPYTGSVTVKEGGEITLSDGTTVTVAPGTTIDPFTGVRNDPDATNEITDDGGSSGGCDAGTAGFALLVFAMIAASSARKKTR